MKFVFLFAFFFVVVSAASTGLSKRNGSASDNVLLRVVELLEGLKETLSKLPLLGKSLDTIFGGLIILVKGLSLLIGVFQIGGAVFELLSGDLNSVNHVLSGLSTTLGAVGSIVGGLGN